MFLKDALMFLKIFSKDGDSSLETVDWSALALRDYTRWSSAAAILYVACDKCSYRFHQLG